MSKKDEAGFKRVINWALRQDNIDNIIEYVKNEDYPDNVEEMLIRFASNKQIMLECIVRQAEIMEQMYAMYEELEELRREAKEDRKSFINTSDSIQ